MKIAITSDIHFHNYSSYISSETVFDVFNQIVDYCTTNEIKRLYILGDLFHVRGKVPVVIFNKVYELFRETTKKGIHIYVLSGNHDQVFNEDPVTTAIYSLNEIKGVELINWNLTNLGDCQIVSIPYLNSSNEFDEALKRYQSKLRPDLTKILFAHGMVKGAVVSSGYSFSQSTGVEQGLKYFDFAFVGHIHDTQRLFDNKVIITGSPLCHSKKDMNAHQRGFWIFDTAAIQIEFVPTSYPHFNQVTINSKKELDDTLSLITKHDFWFLTITTQIDDLEKRLKQYKDYNIELDLVIPVQKTESRLEASLIDSEETIVQSYISKFGNDYDSSLLKTISGELFDEYSKQVESKNV